MRRAFILIVAVSLSIISIAQEKENKFAAVDSFARKVKYKNDLTNMTNELTNRYPDQLQKARAIFRWITENIAYDYKYVNKYTKRNKEPKAYKCKGDEDCEAKRIAWEIKYIDNVLKKNKAICQGYSMLFKKMCDIAGIQSEIVPGYVRTEYYQVGSAGSMDHSWNVILIDSAYYLLDPTWAAGACTKNEEGKLLSYIKEFDEYYWMTPPSDFARNHFPVTGKWALIPNYTKEKFAANPYYHPGEIQHIKLISPATGIIEAKKGDTIQFKIAYKRPFKFLQINSNQFRNPDIMKEEQLSKRKKVIQLDTLALKKQQYIPYHKTGDVYEFSYAVTDESLYYIDVLFDYTRIMRFKVVIKNK